MAAGVGGERMCRYSPQLIEMGFYSDRVTLVFFFFGCEYVETAGLCDFPSGYYTCRLSYFLFSQV